MKILLSAYACRPNSGSEEGNGWNWSVSLAQMNHQVWVLTCFESRPFIEKVTNVQEIPNLHFVYVDTPNNLVQRIMNHTRLSWQYSYFNWQYEALRVAKQLDRKFDFDIVHHVTWGSITAGSRLWLLPKPFVFGPVGGGQTAPPTLKKYFLNDWRNEALRSLLFAKLSGLNWFFRQTVSHADLVLATNQDTYDLAMESGANRTKLFFDPGLPEDYFPTQLPARNVAQNFKLLWVGSLIPRKGLRLTLESLSKVKSAIPFKLTIVGSGSQTEYLSEWIREFGLEQRVDLCGRLPWLKVKELYLSSDVFFFTTLRDSCPTQFLEAMSHGLPIITLNIHGAIKFIPDSAGIKVPVTKANQTVEALANAIEYVYKNPQERLRMGQVGYEFAKTQTWSSKASKMTKYYNELLKKAERKSMINQSR
ncbi:MAG: glycosyltransferase [Cyanobacteria bacterium P01_G01_bin.67]